MSEARIDRISNENNTGGPTLSGITTFSGQNYFVPPRGTTAERPSDAPVGSLRFNTDSAHLEYFDGLQWLELEAFNVELGISNNAAGTSGGLGHRGVFAGGTAPSPSFNTTSSEYITISTLGNTIDFGATFTGRYQLGACSSSTRGLFAGGQSTPGNLTNTIQFVTFSSTGTVTTFGTLNSSNRQNCAGASSSTRGLFLGGQSPASSPGITNTIDYVTIASTGNAQDFGDLSEIVQASSAAASSTRAVRFGGATPTLKNTIDYVTTSTLGNAQDFGDLTAAKWFAAACSNSTRGLSAGNYSATNVIDYITIASTGNATDFGDLNGTFTSHSSCSSPIRAIFGGSSNRIDYVTIATTGNAQDFGDFTINTHNLGAACSNGHGGL